MSNLIDRRIITWTKVIAIFAMALLWFSERVWAECGPEEQDLALDRYFQITDSKTTKWSFRLGGYDLIASSGIWLTLSEQTKEVDITQLGYLKALELAGYVQLKIVNNLGEMSALGWDEFSGVMQKNLGRVEVSATADGKEVTKTYGGGLGITEFTYQPSVRHYRSIVDVKKIASINENYAVVSSMFTNDLSPEGEKIGNALTTVFQHIPEAPACFKVDFTQRRHRGVILLKLDRMDCEWKLVEADWSNSEKGPLCSDDVSKAVGNLGN
jgi:hypothetical protein